jgi:hypothetical protein
MGRIVKKKGVCRKELSKKDAKCSKELERCMSGVEDLRMRLLEVFVERASDYSRQI